MKTIRELKKHLRDYRLKKIDLPTYDDLTELVESQWYLVAEVANYWIKAKAREETLIKEAYLIGHNDKEVIKCAYIANKNGKPVKIPDVIPLVDEVYKKSGLKRLK